MLDELLLFVSIKIDDTIDAAVYFIDFFQYLFDLLLAEAIAAEFLNQKAEKKTVSEVENLLIVGCHSEGFQILLAEKVHHIFNELILLKELLKILIRQGLL